VVWKILKLSLFLVKRVCLSGCISFAFLCYGERKNLSLIGLQNYQFHNFIGLSLHSALGCSIVIRLLVRFAC
jgi:hypothetical protein